MLSFTPNATDQDPDLRSIIALGANLPSAHGAPADTLDRAVDMIEEAGIAVTARSRLYTTPAWPAGAGPDYVNGAVAVRGDGGAPLLEALHRIEAALGRTRKAGRWDARACDLDLLCTGGTVMPDAQTSDAVVAGPAEAARPGLVLPHPLMHLRAFVLVPMAEVAGDWRHPMLGRTVAEMVAALPPEDVRAVRPLSR